MVYLDSRFSAVRKRHSVQQAGESSSARLPRWFLTIRYRGQANASATLTSARVRATYADSCRGLLL